MPTLAENQNDEIGFSSKHVFDGAIQGENVDVMTGNVNIRIPLGPYYPLNEWFGYQVQLYYNSRLWESACGRITPSECWSHLTGDDSYGQGFLLHFGRIYKHPSDKNQVYRYQTPDGSDHYFCSGLGYEECFQTVDVTLDPSAVHFDRINNPQDPNDPLGFIARPGDGTRVYFTWKVQTPFPSPAPPGEEPMVDKREDGAGWYATRIETIAETAGVPQHFVDIHYNVGPAPNYWNLPTIDWIEDSAGRIINFASPPPNVAGTTIITFPAFDNSTAEYTLITSEKTISEPLGTEPQNTRLVLDRIEIPTPDPNDAYAFDYGNYGGLISWTVPTGARMLYDYTGYGTTDGKPLYLEMAYKELEVGGEKYRWSYKRVGPGVISDIGELTQLPFEDPTSAPRVGGSNPYKVKVLDPFDNLTIYRFNYSTGSCDAGGCTSYWDDGTLHQVQMFAGPTENGTRLVKTINYEYGQVLLNPNDPNEPMFEFRGGSSKPGANSVPKNVVTTVNEEIIPGSGGEPTTTRKSTSEYEHGVSIPRPMRSEDTVNGQLYRVSTTYWCSNEQYHDCKNVQRTLDANGQVVSRRDYVFKSEPGDVVTRPQCVVQRLNDDVPEAFFDTAACTDVSNTVAPGEILASHTYEASGNREQTIIQGGDDGSFYTTHYTYDSGVLATKQYGSLGWFAVNRDVDSNTGLIHTSTDPSGAATEYEWDSLGRLTQISPGAPERSIDISYPSLQETHVQQFINTQDYTESVYLYDDLGRVIEEKRRNRDGGYDIRRTKYDISGRVTRSSEWGPEFMPGGAPTTDDDLAWTTFEFNMFPNPNAGEEGEPDAFTDPLGRIVKVTRPDGGTTETDYEGLVTRVTVSGIEGTSGPIDSTTVYRRDELERLIAVDSPANGADASYTYDERDRLVNVELEDIDPQTGLATTQHRIFVYDMLGRLRYGSNPENGTVEYLQYDPRGKLLRHRDARGTEFVNSYDEAGRLLSKAVDDGVSTIPVIVNEYDSVTGLASGDSEGKLVRQFSYKIEDGAQALVATQRNVYGSTVATTCSTRTSIGETSYQGLNGRLWRAISQIEPWGVELEIESCQDTMGRTYVTKYPQYSSSNRIGAEVGSLYVNGYLWEVHDLGRDAEYVSNVKYHSTGTPTAITRGSLARTEIQRDVQGRPTRFDVHKVTFPLTGATLQGINECSSGGSTEHFYHRQRCAESPYDATPQPDPTYTQVWTSGDYQYDLAGNIKQIDVDLFAYDELNRITSADIIHNASQHMLSYQYDAFGNMVQRTQSGVPRGFVVDPNSNRLVSKTENTITNEYAYDANGNLTYDDEQWYVHDERNRLIEVWDEDPSSNTLIAQYDYDAQGFRVRSVVDGVETYFIRDAAGAVLSEYKRVAGVPDTPVWDKDYVYAVGQTVSMVKNEHPAQLPQAWATAVQDDELTLHWFPSEDVDLDHYKVERTTTQGGSENVTFDNIPSGTTSIVDSFDPSVKKLPVNAVHYTVEAVDGATNTSVRSPVLTVYPWDPTPPPVPTGLAAESQDRAIRLTWDAITGVGDLAGYELQREKQLPTGDWVIDVVPPSIPAEEYLDFGLLNGTSYRYKVRSVDTAGNVSAWSAAVVEVPADSVPPGKPLGVVAAPAMAAGQIVVQWLPVLDYDLQGYMVLRGTVPGEGGYVGAVCFNPANPGCQATDPPPPLFVDTDPNLVPGTPYWYTVIAYDTSFNYSEYSDEALGSTRSMAIQAPNLLPPAFATQEVCDPALEGPSPCAPPTQLDTCSIASESNDLIGVNLNWNYPPDPNNPPDPNDPIDGFRIYRANADDSDVTLVDEVDAATLSYYDSTVTTYDHTYYVVAVNSVLESGADPSTGQRVIDDIDPETFKVRNAIAKDGSDDYVGSNKRAREVSLQWSRVLESQLLGYHVYRKCEFEDCSPGLSTVQSFACEPTWTRLTATAVPESPGSRVWVDTTTGGLTGCYTYAVRPVGLDGFEGPMRKVVSVFTQPYGGDAEHCADEELTADHNVPWSNEIDMEVELARVFSVARGTDPPSNPPVTPANVNVTFLTLRAPYWNLILSDTYTRFVEIEWDRNTQSDLAGYHIEMAGSHAGPWKRVTKNPVAWWETKYYIRGAGVQVDQPSDPNDPLTDDMFSGNLQCLHVRVIAIDEEGNESSPGEPSNYPRPECNGGPTPPAPMNLRASTADPDFQNCRTLLEWDEVPGFDPSEVEYYVYWFNNATNAFFFILDNAVLLDGISYPAPATCSGGTCSYEHTGRSHSLCPTYCPWCYAGTPGGGCHNGGVSAFYVTAKGPNGGESPRSNIVFWDCTLDNGYAGLPAAYGDVLLASGDLAVWDIDSFDLASLAEPFPTCDTQAPSVVSVENSSDKGNGTMHYWRDQFMEPGIAPLLRLGQTPDDPPFKIVDIHVDHLGSTRVITDSLGDVVTEHKFFPFGEEISPVLDETTKMFTGHERDQATGLDYMFARHYESNLGRFLSVDPLAESGRLGKPESWNRYAYAFGNPLRFIDPLGLENKVYVVNEAKVDDETMANAKERQEEVVAEEGMTVEVVDEEPKEIDDTDKVQTVTTSDKAKLSASEHGLGTGQVGGQKSEVYVDRIEGNLSKAYGEKITTNPVLMGYAIGNVGAHETGHNLGKRNKELEQPIDLSKPNPDIMQTPMTPATLIRNTPRFINGTE